MPCNIVLHLPDVRHRLDHGGNTELPPALPRYTGGANTAGPTDHSMSSEEETKGRQISALLSL